MNRTRPPISTLLFFPVCGALLALGCADKLLDSGVDLPEIETNTEEGAPDSETVTPPDTETGEPEDSASEGTDPEDSAEDTGSDTADSETASDLPAECADGGRTVPTTGSDACWYVGADNQSCTDLCALHGGLHPDNAAVIGSATEGGSGDNCGQILYRFALLGFPWELEAPITNQGLGCYRFYDRFNNIESNFWISGLPFAPDEAAINIKRVCGCMGVQDGG